MSPVYYMTQINNGTDISEWTWGEFQNGDPEMQTKLNKKPDEQEITALYHGQLGSNQLGSSHFPWWSP